MLFETDGDVSKAVCASSVAMSVIVWVKAQLLVPICGVSAWQDCASLSWQVCASPLGRSSIMRMAKEGGMKERQAEIKGAGGKLPHGSRGGNSKMCMGTGD